MTGREQILGRVRAALVDVPAEESTAWAPGDDDPAGAAEYLRTRSATPERLLELFHERCADYRAQVSRCSAEAIRAAVSAICTRHQAEVLVIAPDLNARWVPGNVRTLDDGASLTTGVLDACDGVLSGCALAIAVTGTIVLDGGPGQGRRALTLVPDLHICIVRSDQIVAGVPEAVTVLSAPLHK